MVRSGSRPMQVPIDEGAGVSDIVNGAIGLVDLQPDIFYSFFYGV